MNRPIKFRAWDVVTKEMVWLGAILADYARITGSTIADAAASRIFDETKDALRIVGGGENEEKG